MTDFEGPDMVAAACRQDLNQGLYDSIHLNFTSSLPRPLLEELAGLVAKDGTGELIEQVSFIRCFRPTGLPFCHFFPRGRN